MENNITKKFNDFFSSITDDIKNLIPEIEKLADIISEKINQPGRIIFIASGASNKIISLITDQLWFNFGITQGKFLVLEAADATNDDPTLIKNIPSNWMFYEQITNVKLVMELTSINLSKSDMVIAVTSSARNNYIVDSLQYCKDIGSDIVAITVHTPDERYKNYCSTIISPHINSYVVNGLSSDAEWGTILKIIIDSLIYCALEKSGRIYHDQLVYLRPISAKLREYAINTIVKLIGVSKEIADEALSKNNNSLEIALISLKRNLSFIDAKNLLNTSLKFKDLFENN